MMDKEQFQKVVAGLEEQAERTVVSIDVMDRTLIAAIREHDPKLADLLQVGTDQRRAASLAIGNYIRSRRDVQAMKLGL